MKILTTFYKMKKGGYYFRFKMMLEALLDANITVHYVAAEPFNLTNKNLIPHILPNPFKSYGMFFKAYMLIVAPFFCLSVAKREKVDILISFGTLYAFIHWACKIFKKIPMITFIRMDSSSELILEGYSPLSVWINKLIEVIGIRLSNKIITVNSHLKEQILTRFNKKENQITILYNNINVPSPKVLSPKSIPIFKNKGFRLVSASVMNRRKNWELLLQVMLRLNKEEVSLFLIGDTFNP
ncbi:MAG: glycosyltransferase, partial [Deltaproteobacteria bacterium]|nr:glycosyltransferase [Deltaproteobacteria bacterium]